MWVFPEQYALDVVSVRKDGGDEQASAFTAPVEQSRMDFRLEQFDPEHPGPGLPIGRLYAEKLQLLAARGYEGFVLINPDPRHLDESSIIGGAVAAAAPGDPRY